MIIKRETNNNAWIRGSMTRNPSKAYKTSNLIGLISGVNIAILTMFPLVVIYLRFIYSILFEKENKITANLRNMGMSMWSHYVSWIVWYNIVLFVTGLVWTLLVWIFVFSKVNPIFIFSLYYLPGAYFIALALFIHSFFTQAKPGVLMALVLFFLQFATTIGQGSFSDPSEFLNILFAISPITGVNFVAQSFLLTQSNYQNFSFYLIFKEINNFRYVYFVVLTVV